MCVALTLLSKLCLGSNFFDYLVSCGCLGSCIAFIESLGHAL
jgi:hypothetical protein